MNGGREIGGRSLQTLRHQERRDQRATVKSRLSPRGVPRFMRTAPMMQVNDKYIENLTPESAIRKLKEMGA